jgi:hypothetical protein
MSVMRLTPKDSQNPKGIQGEPLEGTQSIQQETQKQVYTDSAFGFSLLRNLGKTEIPSNQQHIIKGTIY